MMNIISLDFAPEWECKLLGDLRESDDVRELSQDMLEVNLPNGLSIEVGWFPENDPNGAYEILLCLGMEVKNEFTRKTAYEAKCVIEGLADHYRSEPVVINEHEYRQYTLTNTSTVTV